MEKNVFLFIVDILLLVVVIISGVRYSVAKTEIDKANTLQSEKTTETTQIIAEDGADTEAIRNSLKTEIELLKASKLNNDDWYTIKDIAKSYVEARYNYDGKIQDNVDSILENIKPLMKESFYDNRERLLKNMKSAGNMGAGIQKKQENFCNEDEMYINIDYDVNMNSQYVVVCPLHYESYTAYCKIGIVDFGNKTFLISNEEVVTSIKEDVYE